MITQIVLSDLTIPLSFLVVLPIYAALTSCCTFFVFVWLIFRRKENYLKGMGNSFALKVKIIEQEMEEQIEKRLEAIINGFKAHIPMVSMFLSRSKEEELKEIAKEELIKLVPTLKERVLSPSSELDQDGDLFESLFRFHANQLMIRLWKQVKYPLFLIAVAVGLLLGLLEAALVYLFRYNFLA